MSKSALEISEEYNTLRQEFITVSGELERVFSENKDRAKKFDILSSLNYLPEMARYASWEIISAKETMIPFALVDKLVKVREDLIRVEDELNTALNKK